MQRDMRIIYRILNFMVNSNDRFVDLSSIKDIDKPNLDFNICLLREEQYILTEHENSLLFMTWKGFDLYDHIKQNISDMSKDYWR